MGGECGGLGVGVGGSETVTHHGTLITNPSRYFNYDIIHTVAHMHACMNTHA